MQARASVVKAPVTKTKQTCVRICSYLKVFRKLHICYLNEYIVVFNLCFCWQTTPTTTYETFPRYTRISDTEVRWKTAENTLYLNIIIFHLATACFYFRWRLSCPIVQNTLCNFLNDFKTADLYEVFCMIWVLRLYHGIWKEFSNLPRILHLKET